MNSIVLQSIYHTSQLHQFFASYCHCSIWYATKCLKYRSIWIFIMSKQNSNFNLLLLFDLTHYSFCAYSLSLIALIEYQCIPIPSQDNQLKTHFFISFFASLEIWLIILYWNWSHISLSQIFVIIGEMALQVSYQFILTNFLCNDTYMDCCNCGFFVIKRYFYVFTMIGKISF